MTAGHRLCLVFNLVCTEGAGAAAAVLSAAGGGGSGPLGVLQRALAAWEADAAGPAKFVYLLEHR